MSTIEDFMHRLPNDVGGLPSAPFERVEHELMPWEKRCHALADVLDFHKIINTEEKRRGVEAIVLAAEEPTRIRGGALLGGRGDGAREASVGAATRYVVDKAPCRVILTAPPVAKPDVDPAPDPTAAPIS